jgi:ferritin-like metal-binding protein YciE
MADKLGLTDAVGLLEESLQEEEAALNKLKTIASEFDVTDDADQVEETEEDAEEQHATSRR